MEEATNITLVVPEKAASSLNIEKEVSSNMDSTTI